MHYNRCLNRLPWQYTILNKQERMSLPTMKKTVAFLFYKN